MADFRFSLPPIAQLYPDQHLAYDPRQTILVTGGPGSGKTVITIFRFLRAIRESRDILLFTFNRTLIYSIRGMLNARAEELFGDFDEDQIEMIVENQLATFYQWHKDHIGWFTDTATEAVMGTNFQQYIIGQRQNRKYSELFFDEGQDLPAAVYANVFALANIISVGADKAQNFRGYYPPDAVEEIINEKLSAQTNSTWAYLGGNFRNTKAIFDLAKQFVPNDLLVQAMNTTTLRTGNTPEIETGFNTARQLAYILRIIDGNPNSNIGILVHFGNKVIEIKEFLESNGYSCEENALEGKSFSYYRSGMSRSHENVMKKKLKTPFVTTFDSCKGLEFDIVILPFFEQSDWAMTNIRNDGRPWATRNHYYVAVTRAKTDIFILCDGKPNVLNFYNAPQIVDDDDLPF